MTGFETGSSGIRNGRFVICVTTFFIINLTATLMAFTGITNAHGPSPYATACKPPTCSLTTTTGSNRANVKVSNYNAKEVWGGWGSSFVATYLDQPIQLYSQWSSIITSNHDLI